MNIYEAVQRGEANRVRRAEEAQTDPTPEPKTYFCWDCGRKHWLRSMIGQAHDPRRP